MSDRVVHSTRDQFQALELAISAEQNSPARLPGLVNVFNRLPEVYVQDIGALSYIKPEIQLASLKVGRFADFSNLPKGAAGVVVRAEKWRGDFFFVADGAAAAVFLEAVLGSDPESTSQPSVKSLTAAENSIVSLLFKRLARSLADAFSTYVDITFDVNSIGDREAFERSYSPTALVLIGQLKITYAGRSGLITVALPQKTLASVREALGVTNGIQEKITSTGGDPDWSQQLSTEIARAFIDTMAVLDQQSIMLRDVAAFRLGSIVALSTPSISRACLEIDDQPLFWCQLGRQSNHLALEIEQACTNDLEAAQEF